MIKSFAKLVVVLSTIVGFFLPVFAEEVSTSEMVEADRDPASVSDGSDAVIANKVKRKSYTGGADEGELKVQPILQTPTRRMAPVQNNTEPAEPHEPSAND